MVPRVGGIWILRDGAGVQVIRGDVGSERGVQGRKCEAESGQCGRAAVLPIAKHSQVS